MLALACFQHGLRFFLLSWQRFWRARFLYFIPNGANMADRLDGSQQFHDTPGGLRFVSSLASKVLATVNSEVSWQMGRGLIGSVDVAPVLCQDDLKQLDGLRSAFFCPIIPETHVVGTLDQILDDSFPEEVGEGHPIDLHLSIALKKRISVW